MFILHRKGKLFSDSICVSYFQFLEVPRLDKESPLEDLDDTSLWIPQSENHDIWIKTLTCAILDSKGTKSEILQLLKPMCEVSKQINLN